MFWGKNYWRFIVVFFLIQLIGNTFQGQQISTVFCTLKYSGNIWVVLSHTCTVCICNHVRGKEKVRRKRILIPFLHLDLLNSCFALAQVMEFYCPPCETAMCQDCTSGEHAEHPTVPLKDVVDQHKASLQEQLDAVKNRQGPIHTPGGHQDVI